MHTSAFVLHLAFFAAIFALPTRLLRSAAYRRVEGPLAPKVSVRALSRDILLRTQSKFEVKAV